MMDIESFSLPVLAHSAVCWIKDANGDQMKDEDGQKIGIEFWSVDSVQGLKAEIAAGRARSELEERLKDADQDTAIAERIVTVKLINIKTAALMFKAVHGDLTFNGEPITPENSEQAFDRLPAWMIRQFAEFINNPEANYLAKP